MKIYIRFSKLWLQILRQVIFTYIKKIENIFYSIFNKKKELKNLIQNGYLHIQGKIPLDFLNYIEKKYHKFDLQKVSVVESVALDQGDLDKIFNYLKDRGIMDIIKGYLGKKMYSYQNVYNYLDDKESNQSSWQPHHDSKYNRLKVYIWISQNSNKAHPIYYLKGSHMEIKTWINNSETRFPENFKKLEEILGNPGDIVIFDTHGIHSNFKFRVEPRKNIILTFDPVGIFSRINPYTKKGKKILKMDNSTYLH